MEQVLKAVGQGSYIHVPFPPQRESIDIRKFVVTCWRMIKDTGWQPQVSLEDGVEKTVQFYRRRHKEYLTPATR
ncbi:MAG: hypothetical protein BWY83_01085 [bacterium ADurb.Bin478]|nr:MAG: hypothetical protein BWY83_01085 [bacterium ADurb.Bin478]